MENQDSYLNDFDRKFVAVCNEAVLDMIKECALHDELVVMTDKSGSPIWVRAREVLEKNPELKNKDVDYTPIEVDIKEIIKRRR